MKEFCHRVEILLFAFFSGCLLSLTHKTGDLPWLGYGLGSLLLATAIIGLFVKVEE